MMREYFGSLPAASFPNIVALAEALTEGGPDERFEFGLDVIVRTRGKAAARACPAAAAAAESYGPQPEPPSPKIAARAASAKRSSVRRIQSPPFALLSCIAQAYGARGAGRHPPVPGGSSLTDRVLSSKICVVRAGSGETVGERIRRLRAELGLSQRSLSGPGVSAGYICRVERGQRTPSMKALRVIAPRLGVSPEFLETGSDLSESDQRALQLADAELELRLSDDPAAAEKKLRAVLAEVRAADDRPSIVRAQIALGFAAAQRGAHREAIELLEQAIDDPIVSPATHPGAYATLAQAYVTVAPDERAVDLFEHCLEEIRAQRPQDVAALVRFGTYLSYALSDLGDLAGAKATLDEVLANVDGTLDPYSRIRLYWSQARLADIEGKHALAQEHLGRAMALLTLTEDELTLGRAHLLYAESTLSEGRLEEAAERLEVAQQLLGRRAEIRDRAILRVLNAQVLARTGEPDAAADVAGEALALVGDDDPELRGRAETALAEALWRQGNLEESLAQFQSADQSLARGAPRYVVPFLELWSSVLEEAGRLSEALAVYKRGVALAAQPPPRRLRTRRAGAPSEDASKAGRSPGS